MKMNLNRKILCLLFLAAIQFNAYSAIITVTSNTNNGEGSLRQAIADANSGDTIKFATNITAITLTSGEIPINKNLTIDGGAENTRVTISGNNNSRIFNVSGSFNIRYSLNINNLVLLNGRSDEGGAVRIRYGVFTATNCEFNNNSVSSTSNRFGGAVSVRDGTFTATNCKFNNNSVSSTVAGYGGAVCVWRGTFTATNCEFNNNSASATSTVNEVYGSGGAVYIRDYSNFIATNCEFNNNSASASATGGNNIAAGAKGGAVLIYSSSGFTATNCIFDNNSVSAFGRDTAFMGGYSSRGAFGGAVSVEGPDTINAFSFTATDCIFTNNTATTNTFIARGGFLYAGSTFLLTNCEISNNSAISTASPSSQGGAIWRKICKPAAIINTIFACNSAREGGAVFIYGRDACTWPDLDDNGSYFYHCTFDANVASQRGGAMYISVRDIPNSPINSVVPLYIYNNVFVGNTVGGVVTASNQIQSGPGNGTQITGTNRNLIHNGTTITQQTVFGSDNCYLIPLPFARSAERLTSTNFVKPLKMNVSQILNIVARDQKGNMRPTTGNVSYGALEAGSSSSVTTSITLNKNIEEAGTVADTIIQSSTGCVCNEYAIIEVIPNDCYRFLHWANSAGNIVSEKQIDTLRLTSDSSLIAVFEKADYSITVSVVSVSENTSEGGTATVIENVDCEGIILATPNDCYIFLYWIDSAGNIISENQTVILQLISDSSLIAVFEKADYSITVSENISEGGEATVLFNEDCETMITAIPNDCYKFLYWIDTDGKIISTKQIDTLKLNSDSSLVAVFYKEEFFLTVEANPADGGTVSENSIGCTVAEYQAFPNDCYKFINWTDANSGEIISTNLTDTILMLGDRKLIANFEFYNYNIELSSEFYIDEKPLPAGYSHQLNNKSLPKLRVKYNSDIPKTELSNITVLNISFDYCNVFSHINTSSLKLSSGWTATNSNNSNDFSNQISNYSLTIFNPLGLSFGEENLFEIEFTMALPNSEMIKGKIENEHYKLLISSKLTLQNASCITTKSDTSQLNIASICVIDYRILKFSDLDFDLQITENSINYSIAFDCEASLTVYNSLGQAILIPVSGAITKGVYTLDISDITFPTGAYFCELRIDGVYRKVVGMVVKR